MTFVSAVIEELLMEIESIGSSSENIDKIETSGDNEAFSRLKGCIDSHITIGEFRTEILHYISLLSSRFHKHCYLV